MLAALLGMAGRLAYLQMVRGDEYRQAAADLLQYTERRPAARGRILDRGGRVLAFDRPTRDFCLDYRFLTEDARWIRRQKQRIRRQLGVSAAEAEAIYQRRAGNTWRMAEELSGQSRQELEQTVVAGIVRRFETLRARVGMEVREQRQAHPVVLAVQREIHLDPREIVGASIRHGGRRWYPRGPIACHVLGLTGEVSDEEQERLNVPEDQGPWLERMQSNYLAGDRIGKSGVEKLCESVLRGRRGYRRIKRPDTVLDERPAVPGGDVHLTIDIELQQGLTDLLRTGQPNHNGCIVILSLPRGQVLAMVSRPTYDLNTYRREFDSLAGDAVNQPLFHRAARGLYPPGSTVKPLTAIAALSDGTITLGTTYHCRGRLFPGVTDKFRCWNRSGHGPLSVSDALMNSCNVFFYRVGEGLGVPRMAHWLGEFGFAARPGTGLPEERSGQVPAGGIVGEARMLAMGQGRIAVSPLHVANAMATIACGGEFRSPVLVLEGGPVQVRRKVPAAAEAFRIAQEGMYRVVNDPASKTAYKYFHKVRDAGGNPIPPLGVAVCGKSGTAQTSSRVIDEDGDGRPDRTIEGETLWFAGFAPRRRPRIAYAVMLEYVQGGGGSRTAGPIAREAIRLCKQFGYLDP